MSIRNAFPGAVALAALAPRLDHADRVALSAQVSRPDAHSQIQQIPALVQSGPDTIRVNAALPGIGDGPRMDGVIADRAGVEGIGDAAIGAGCMADVPMGRMVTVQDAAGMELLPVSPAGATTSGHPEELDINVEPS